MESSKVTLGEQVQDTVTGFEGTATGRIEYLGGETQIRIEALKDGEVKQEWFPEGRIAPSASCGLTSDPAAQSQATPAPAAAAAPDQGAPAATATDPSSAAATPAPAVDQAAAPTPAAPVPDASASSPVAPAAQA